MKFILFTLICIFFANGSLFADIGQIEKMKGIVKIKHKNSFKKRRVKVKSSIKKGDIISTSKDSYTSLHLNDGSKIVLGESSIIHFIATNEISQNNGKIFYKIVHRNKKNILKIKTPFAIIGIKGTTFIVNADKKNNSVALQEGLIGIGSIKGEFLLYTKEILASYNRYIDKQLEDFKKYQKIKGLKPEKTKKFDLKANNIVSFSNNIVQESSLSSREKASFENFERFLHSGKVVSQSRDKEKTLEEELDDLKGPSRAKDPARAMKESMNFD